MPNWNNGPERTIAAAVLIVVALLAAVFLISPKTKDTGPDSSGDLPQESLKN
jgi:hypothetical protein